MKNQPEPPVGSEVWHFFQLLALAMEQGLGRSAAEGSWSNAELSKASGFHSRNAIGVKSIEAWRNGTDLPLHHLDTLLNVFTSGLSDEKRSIWIDVLRKSITLDRSISRQHRQRAYRALRAERKVLSQTGHGLIPTNRMNGFVLGLRQQEVYLEAGLQVPQAATLDFQAVEGRVFGDLPAGQFLLQLAELSADENTISSAIKFFEERQSSESTLALTQELDSTGLLARSWKLRRSVASAIAKVSRIEGKADDISAASDLHSLVAGSLLTPLLVGPLSQHSIQAVENLMRHASDASEANPQFHWEISRHLTNSNVERQHFPASIKRISGQFGSVELEILPENELKEIERLLLQSKRIESTGGRYGLATRELLLKANNLSDSVFSEHISELSRSKHEGVRWSIVRVLAADAVRQKIGSNSLKTLVLRFAKDQNPWVLRELMSVLNTTPIVQNFADKKILFEVLKDSIQKAIRSGVPNEELMPEFLALCSKWPEALYLFNALLR